MSLSLALPLFVMGIDYTLGIIFTIEMLIMLLSAYPLLHFMGIIGIITWSIIMIITIVTSLVVEKTKKKQ